jgi:hypothetical protein
LKFYFLRLSPLNCDVLFILLSSQFFCTSLNTLDSSHHITHSHIPPHTPYHPHSHLTLTLTLTTHTHAKPHHLSPHHTPITHNHILTSTHHTQALKAALSGVIVQGIPTVSRAVINEELGPKGNKTYYLLGQTRPPSLLLIFKRTYHIHSLLSFFWLYLFFFITLTYPTSLPLLLLPSRSFSYPPILLPLLFSF